MTQLAKVGTMETKHPATSTEIQEYDSLSLPMQQVEITSEQIRKHIAPGATATELFWFIGQCKTFGLNPLKKEIYFVKYDKSKPGEAVVGFQTYLARAEMTGKLDGWSVALDQDDFGQKAIVTIHRNDWKQPFMWETYREEFDKKRSTWNIMPLYMLKKVAISQAFRLCFPELGGMPYTSEELQGTRGLAPTIAQPPVEVAIPEVAVPEPSQPEPTQAAEEAGWTQADPSATNKPRQEDTLKCHDCGMALKPGPDDPRVSCPNPGCFSFEDAMTPVVAKLAKCIGTTHIIALDFATDYWPARELLEAGVAAALASPDASARLGTQFKAWQEGKAEEAEQPPEPQNGLTFDAVVVDLAKIYEVDIADLGNFSQVVGTEGKAFLKFKEALEKNGLARKELYSELQAWRKEQDEQADRMAEENGANGDLPGIPPEQPNRPE